MADSRFKFDWTPEAIEKLKAMRDAGEAGSSIAKALGNGCTRNMVLGKIWRLALDYPDDQPRKAAALRRAQEHKKALQGKPRKPSLKPKPRIYYPPPPPEIYTGTGITLAERTGCCWPLNDGRPFVFCNAAKQRGDYCEYHAWLRVQHKPLKEPQPAASPHLAVEATGAVPQEASAPVAPPISRVLP